MPEHKHNPFCKDRGKIVGAYVVAKTCHGDYLTTPMSIDEIYEIRNRSEAYKKGYGPWVDFEGEMIKKTVVKRAAKLWPRTPQIMQLEKAIDVVNEHEGINFEERKQEQLEEKAALDADYIRKKDDCEPGLNYKFIWGQFKGKRIKECDEDDLYDYFLGIQEKVEANKKGYRTGDKYETYQMMDDFFKNRDLYYSELESEV